MVTAQALNLREDIKRLMEEAHHKNAEKERHAALGDDIHERMMTRFREACKINHAQQQQQQQPQIPALRQGYDALRAEARARGEERVRREQEAQKPRVQAVAPPARAEKPAAAKAVEAEDVIELSSDEEVGDWWS